MLVSTEWLEQQLDEPSLRIIDIRGQVPTTNDPDVQFTNHYGDYLHSHIPGALYVDWINELTNNPQHMQIAEPDAFAAVMSRVGIGPNTFVVAYDDSASVLAARLWWSLNYYGHAKVAVLDGGWNKWLQETRPVSAEIPPVQPSRFEPKPNYELRREGHEVLYALNGTTHIVDTRSPEEYMGDESLTRLSGHIPGAVNLPINRLIAEDGTLLPADELRRRFAEVGIDEAVTQVIFYGNVGVSSCLGLLALQAAGLQNGSNYDGSWQEWGNDEKKPVEQGA